MSAEAIEAAVAIAIGGTVSYVLGRLIYSWLQTISANLRGIRLAANARSAHNQYYRSIPNLRLIVLVLNNAIILVAIAVLFILTTNGY